MSDLKRTNLKHAHTSHKKTAKKSKHQGFDKYELYSKAVQSPEGDVEFYIETYEKIRGKNPISLREDFCGTFALSAEWVKYDSKHVAHGIDIDPEPMDYGKKKYLSKLTPAQQKRIHIAEGDVLKSDLPKVDIAAAVNFSYFIFKKREIMKQYFSNVHRSLKKDGIFILDVFGGTQCTHPIEDVHPHKGFKYYWDQTSFDPVSNEALFHIHFKLGSQKIEKVFTYDWRMWSIPELRDLLKESGFKKTSIYWEGTNRQGTGNGIFSRTEKGEPCLSWIAYIVAEK